MKEERYKALGGGTKGLIAFGSPDGIRWKKLREQPVITQGAFDSQNLAFWDTDRAEYRAYFRDFRKGRDIKTCTSKDFLVWTDPVFLEYTPERISELYTNQILPYPRAPHLLLGFPTRYTDRGWTAAAKLLPQYDYRRIRASQSQREGTALTDGMFMSSRDRHRFAIWPESFIRPGLKLKGNWFYGDNYQSLGLVETPSSVEGAPEELSFYVTESSLQGESVSLAAPHPAHRRICVGARGVQRRRNDNPAVSFHRQAVDHELFDLDRRGYPRGNSRRPGHSHSRIRAGGWGGVVRRLARPGGPLEDG